MPIIGLTTNRKPNYPEIGQLRKGDKKPERGPGKDLDHFRFTSDHPEVAAAFFAEYGPTPRSVNVLLPFDRVEDAFEAWKEEYSAGALKHRCDGETCVVWMDAQGNYHTTPKPCPGNCKQVGRLKVIIPELGRLAVVTALTTSKHDIMNLQDSFDALERETPNGLRGIPLVLRRVKKMISENRDGKRVRAAKWLLEIEAGPNWVKLQLQARQQAALPGARPTDASPLQIGPAPDPIDYEIDEDDAEVENGEIEEIHEAEPVVEAPASDPRARAHQLRAKLIGIGVPAEAVDRKVAVMGRGVYEIDQIPVEDMAKVEQMLSQFVGMGEGAIAAMTGNGKAARK